MAKAKGKKQKSRADSVRSAVDQAFSATADRAGVTQKRAQEIVDELAGTVGRLRDALEDARPATATELDALRADLAALSARVDGLEKAALRRAATPAGGRAPAARKPAARKPAATPASKVPAARAAAKRTAKRRAS